MSLLQAIALKKPNSKAKERLKACLTCPLKQRWMYANWCGTPLDEEEVLFADDNGKLKEIKTCGCNVKFKVKVDEQKCPLNKWPD